MATIADIARASGYANVTVAQILSGRPGYNPKTREYVLRIARELNYEPSHSAKALATGKTRTIGIVLGKLENDVASPWFTPTLGALVRTLQAHNYHAPMLPVDSGEPYRKQVLRLARGRHVDGLFIARRLVDAETFHELAERGTPTVTVDEGVPADGSVPVNIVRRDARPGVAALAKALKDAGHQRVIYLALQRPQPSRQEIEHGNLLKEELAAHDIALDDETDVLRVPVLQQDSSYAEWVNTRRLAEEHQARLLKYTAVICRHDGMALAVADSLRAADIMPGRDIALVGSGNMECNPPFSNDAQPVLTTVDPCNELVGQRAGEIVCQHLKEPDRPHEVHHVQSRLVIRESFRVDERPRGTAGSRDAKSAGPQRHETQWDANGRTPPDRASTHRHCGGG